MQPGYQNIACMDGTLHYLPPENMRCQLYHKKRIITSERKDTWAVGVVLFRLFCGSLPFDMRDLWSADLKGESYTERTRREMGGAATGSECALRRVVSLCFAEAVGYANANDLDFTQCHPDTPLLILVRQPPPISAALRGAERSTRRFGEQKPPAAPAYSSAQGLIRLLLNPNVTSRPTLRDVYIHHPLFAMSDEAIASGKKARDVQEAVVREDPSLAVFIKPSRSK